MSKSATKSVKFSLLTLLKQHRQSPTHAYQRDRNSGLLTSLEDSHTLSVSLESNLIDKGCNDEQSEILDTILKLKTERAKVKD